MGDIVKKIDVRDHGKPLDRSHCHLCGSDKPGGGHVGKLDDITFLACEDCWHQTRAHPQAFSMQLKTIREMRK